MNELIGKLTNLTYELFGVIIPGLVMAMFLLAWWLSLGGLASKWSRGVIPHLDPSTLPAFLEAGSTWAALIPGIAVVYFLGHLLLWVGRSGPIQKSHEAKAENGKHAPEAEGPKKEGEPKPSKPNLAKKLWACLRFRIPRPEHSFDPSLQMLFDQVRTKFAAAGPDPNWRQFYPMAKSYIAQRLRYSLIATYQNKYTLHRSITTASAALFWLSLIGTVGGRIEAQRNRLQSPLWAQILLMLLSLVLVWGFSGGYELHWRMFGDTIVTESYTLLLGPKDDRPSIDKAPHS